MFKCLQLHYEYFAFCTFIFLINIIETNKVKKRTVFINIGYCTPLFFLADYGPEEEEETGEYCMNFNL